MAYTDTTTVYLKTGLSSTEISVASISSLINLADAEIDSTTNQKFSSGNSFIEYSNVYPPKRADDLSPNRLLTKHYPIQSITEFLLLDSSGTTVTTLSTMPSASITAGNYITANYYCEPESGLIELTSHVFDYVPRKAKLTYTYGCSTVPTVVGELSSCLAGVRAWINFLGGQYNRLNQYSVPETSINKGDFYARGKQIIDDLSKKSEELFNQLQKKQRSAFCVTSGGYF